MINIYFKIILYWLFSASRSIFRLGCYISLISITITLFISSFFFQVIVDSPILTANLEDIHKINNWKPKNNTLIFDKNGKILSEQFNHYHIYIPFEKVPKKFIDTILAIEDRKYFSHPGIDIFGIIRAIRSHLKGNKITEGASTITQQVVKNLLLTSEKTIERKIREMVLSLYLEQVVSKEKIFEIYINTMFLGNGSYGIAAAGKRYFGKELNDLEEHEMALIAGLFQSPSKFDPTRNPKAAKNRQVIVLKALKEFHGYSDQFYEDLKSRELDYQEYESTYGKLAPYFVEYILKEANVILKKSDLKLKGSGLKIHTTMDSTLQHLAESTIQESSDIFKKMESSIYYDTKHKKDDALNPVEVALIAIDRRTGEIRSMIGGKNFEISKFNRATESLRAPGSTFKPITYLTGLENGLSWNKQFYITPITIGNYRPRSDSRKLYTQSTMFQAFYQSTNAPAVLIGDKIGMNKVFRTAKNLGIESHLKDEAATLLGSSEVSMMEMAQVYQVFSNQGKKVSLIGITKIEDQEGKIIYEADALEKRTKIKFRKENIDLLNEGLKAVVKYGTGYKVRHLSGKAAGKTGTSNKSKDNWFCGFTDDLVIITWMGNDEQNSFDGRISASNTAAPLWGRFAGKSISYLKTKRLDHSRNVEFAKIHPVYGHRSLNGVMMPFRKGHAPIVEESDLMALEEGQKLRVSLHEL